MLLLLALDGATFDLLTPWMAAGYLPTLARLVAEGTAGELASTLPPVTAPAWASFMTGMHPAGHGLYDFFHHPAGQPQNTQMVHSGHIRAPLFWDYLSAAGRTVGVLNVPVTHPPRPVNGYLIPGLLSPDQGATCYPAGVWQPYASELGPYRLTPAALYRPGQEAAFIADLHALTRTQFAYARRLLHDRPVDFFMLHILATDIAQHKLWRHMDPAHPWHDPAQAARFGPAIRELFQQIDRALADLLASLPPGSTTLVMSDHGFGPQQQTANLNILFLASGLLRLKPGRGTTLRRAAARHPLTTRLGQRLWQREKLLDFADVDWPNSRAYALGHMGQVYLTPPGRANPQATLAAITTALHSLRQPGTGQPLAVTILPASAAGPGPYQSHGPDLHLILDGYRTVAYPMFAADGRILTAQRLGDSGHHRANGIFIAHGPGIRPGYKLAGARLVDLAPTILHLLGVPIPTGLDGHLLSGALLDPRPGPTQPPLPPPTDPATTLPASEQAEIAARLQALGYMEG